MCLSFWIPQDALLDRSQTWSTQHILICCVCLGDNSEDADEIIQCDNCGVTVHEGKLQSRFNADIYSACQNHKYMSVWLKTAGHLN